MFKYTHLRSEDKYIFFNEHHTLKCVKMSDIIVVMGDPNVNVGCSNINFESLMAGNMGLEIHEQQWGEYFADLRSNH